MSITIDRQITFFFYNNIVPYFHQNMYGPANAISVHSWYIFHVHLIYYMPKVHILFQQLSYCKNE